MPARHEQVFELNFVPLNTISPAVRKTNYYVTTYYCHMGQLHLQYEMYNTCSQRLQKKKPVIIILCKIKLKNNAADGTTLALPADPIKNKPAAINRRALRKATGKLRGFLSGLIMTTS